MKTRYFLVSVFDYLNSMRLHLKLMAVDESDAYCMASCINTPDVIYEISEPEVCDNARLRIYLVQDSMIFCKGTK